MPVAQALVLDPWLEPLPSPGPAPYLNQNAIVNPELNIPSTGSSESTLQGSGEVIDVLKSSSLPRMLVLNSDPFTLWEDHFERLKGVVEAWEPDGRSVLTLSKYQIDDAILTYSSSFRIQFGLYMYRFQTFPCCPSYGSQVQRS